MDEKRILIVDDDPLICKMFKRCIASASYFKDKDIKVSYVLGIRERGINKVFRPEKYHLIVTDWECPQANNGFHVVSYALKHGIPCIVYTGDTLSAKCFLKNYDIEIPIIDKSDDISKLMEVINGIIIR
jgi:DNA-binding NtrC family response regulator